MAAKLPERIRERKTPRKNRPKERTEIELFSGKTYVLPVGKGHFSPAPHRPRGKDA